jgi:hypothetical protein
MGLPVPTDIDGRTLTEILTSESIKARQVEVGRPLGRWPDEATPLLNQQEMSDEDEELVRDRLRALGYVE